MNEQMESFNTYLEVARTQQAAGKKKKKVKGIKFSYSKLQKMGIIIDSTVPEKSRKATSFTISLGDNTNEFFVKAKVAGITADAVTLHLDDLLEKQSQNIDRLELENITLDVNLTISFINKNFLQKA
jgi:Ras GTPase-activating-like protein IQGAP2/3